AGDAPSVIAYFVRRQVLNDPFVVDGKVPAYWLFGGIVIFGQIFSMPLRIGSGIGVVHLMDGDICGCDFLARTVGTSDGDETLNDVHCARSPLPLNTSTARWMAVGMGTPSLPVFSVMLSNSL